MSMQEEILEFWFGRPGMPEHGVSRSVWFRKDPAFDAEIWARFGVAMLRPRPSMLSTLWIGLTTRADSAPRTQCGTFTGCWRTFSRPSAFICSATQATARSRLGDPLRRLPIRVVR